LGVDVLQFIFLSRGRHVGRLSRLLDRSEEVKLGKMCRSVGSNLDNTLWRQVGFIAGWGKVWRWRGWK
jgi:hypothetical protein